MLSMSNKSAHCSMNRFNTRVEAMNGKTSSQTMIMGEPLASELTTAYAGVPYPDTTAKWFSIAERTIALVATSHGSQGPMRRGFLEFRIAAAGRLRSERFPKANNTGGMSWSHASGAFTSPGSIGHISRFNQT